jgi:uncharacterized protein (UPF0147 family)
MFYFQSSVLSDLWIQDQQLPRNVVDANEGVRNVCAEVPRNVTDSVASLCPVLDGPALEVAHHSARLIT